MHSFEPDIFSDTELVSEELLDCGIAILVAGCFWDGVKQQVVSHAAPRQVAPPNVYITALIVETVAPSGDHYSIDLLVLVVLSSDHCCIETVPPSSDHY